MILERKANKMIKEYSDSSSEFFYDLIVWFKNFDAFRRKWKFELDPYETLYSFYDCDMILNDRNIVIIGKMKILGKEKPLNPTIFEFEKTGEDFKPRHVKIESINEVSSDLEIEFSDPKYKDNMILVI